MREYELTMVYDLAVAEAGGPDASVQHLTTQVEARGGNVIRVDHWGRRRMAYPIGRAIDGDYIVSRVNLDPAAVESLEAHLKIDEKVYRHPIVRADELPPPQPQNAPALRAKPPHLRQRLSRPRRKLRPRLWQPPENGAGREAESVPAAAPAEEARQHRRRGDAPSA
jgi:small subunit ribosomal protein S6